MIGSLRGTLAERLGAADTASDVIVDVGGVGYRVSIGARHAAGLGPLGSSVSLAVHTHVREGAITLYGFADPGERRAFELLIGAHGVGPALALAVLSSYSPSEIAHIVAEEDIDALMVVPGVGRKTAARLLIDLGQRADELAGLPPHATAGSHAVSRRGSSAQADVAEALAALGYGQDEIRMAVVAAGDSGTAEELLRRALRELAPSR